jgi:hypothetical protein
MYRQDQLQHQEDSLFIVRSHAVATFIVGKGHEPLDVDLQGMAPVYLFRDDAHDAMVSYNNAKLVLASMVERKERGGAK